VIYPVALSATLLAVRYRRGGPGSRRRMRREDASNEYVQYGFDKVLAKNVVSTTYSFTAQQFANQSYLTAVGHETLREALLITQLNYTIKL